MFCFVVIRNDVYEDCLMKWEDATIEYIIADVEWSSYIKKGRGKEIHHWVCELQEVFPLSYFHLRLFSSAYVLSLFKF